MTTAFDEAVAVFDGAIPSRLASAPRVPASAVDLFDPPKVQFWTPYPKQAAAAELTTRCFELLFGGAAGPGKSHFLRGHACDYATAYPGAHIGLVRRYLPQLKQTHGLHLPAMVGEHAQVNLNDGTYTFANGSVIRFISLPHAGDEQKFKSAEFDVLLFDELTEFLESQYTFMISRVRSARGHPTHIVATSNPEGVGFRWVKRRFVAPRPEDLAEGQDRPAPGVPWSPPNITDGTVTSWQRTRCFLPATLADNPGLRKSNPEYVLQLESLPDTRLRRALVDGDWNAMDTVPGALWSQDMIDTYRVASAPALVRTVTGVDPSGTSQNGTSECGIVAGGIDARGHVYITVDASGSLTPDQWAARVARTHHQVRGDLVVAEKNYGGEMVSATLLHTDPTLPVELITSSRGKQLRAEPVSAVTARGLVHFVGRLPELEDQMTTWIPGSGWSPDRLDACLVGETPVLTMRGDIPIRDVVVGDLVWTREGWRPVVVSKMTRVAAPVGTVTFSDGAVLTGTGDHPVWTENRGWQKLDALVFGDTLCAWSLHSQLPTGVSSTSGTLTLSSVPTGSTTTPRGAAAGACSTGTSGRTTTPALTSPADGTSTTETRTPSTTTRATWSSSTPSSTPRRTATPACHWTTWTESVILLLTGIARMLLGTCMSAMLMPCGLTASTSPRRAKRVATTIRPAGPGMTVGTVPRRASRPLIGGTTPTRFRSPARSAANCSGSPSTGVRPSPARVSVRGSFVDSGLRADVYDLMVDGVHEFVAGGVIVHNCVFVVTELLGGAAALAFLTQLSAPCPECGVPNTTGRPVCIQCGGPLPHALPTRPAALPDEAPVEFPTVPAAPGTEGPAQEGFALAGLLLPSDPAAR